MNPILVDLEYDNTKLIVKKGKTFVKSFINEATGTSTQYSHTPYNVLYNYPNHVTNTFNMLTCYVPLGYHSVGIKNKFNSCVSFGIYIDNNTETETASAVEKKKFHDFVVSICEDIKKEVNKEVVKWSNTLPDFSLPYVESDDKCTFTVHLKSVSKQEDPNNKKIMTHYNICPIHFHQPKSKGGNIIVMNKEEIYETNKNIDKEMPIFKTKLYMKKINKPEFADRKDIHYVGKFVLGFEVELSAYSVESLGSNNVKCKIHLVATEMEIKHNVSYCKSVLYGDVVSVNIKQNEIESLTI